MGGKRRRWQVRARYRLAWAVACGLAAAPAAAQQPAPVERGDQIITQEQASGTGAALRLSPSTVRRIQQELNKRGYHAGHVDGSWGPVTAAATKNFQQAQGLEPTGRANLRTLEALGIEVSRE